MGNEVNGILPVVISNSFEDEVLVYDGITGDLVNQFTQPSFFFGEAIDIDGDRLLVGALREDVNGESDVGEAYLYNWITGELLQTFTNPNPTEDDLFGNSLGIDGDTIFISARNDDFAGEDSGLVYVYELGMGQEQENPILPSVFDADTQTYTFNDVITGQWFDPPFVDAFTYEITNPESLFTKILDFPTGFDDSFTVSVDGNDLGTFGPSEMVDFVDLLGTGVKEFTVSGIDPLVDAEDPLAFPIKLEFDTLRASFTMSPAKQTQTTPEPGFMLGFLGLGTWLVTRRKSNQN